MFFQKTLDFIFEVGKMVPIFFLEFAQQDRVDYFFLTTPVVHPGDIGEQPGNGLG